MALASPAAVRQQIADNRPDPIYLLLGEDDVDKLALAREFDQLVEEGLRPFNVERLHVAEATTGEKVATAIASLVSASRTLPMMAPRRVVVVPRAEAILAPKRESETAAKAFEELEALLKEPEPQTTLVFVASLDRRSRAYKLLLKQATVVECGVIESLADAERWVRNRMAAAGVQIDSAASRLLAARCGTDVVRLRNDVERLQLYALGQQTITADDVREIAGPEALQDDWAMTNAIEVGDRAAALRQLALLLDAGAPPEKILGQLGWVVRSKLSAVAPRRLRAAVDAVFRTDLDLKASATDARLRLERLVLELCGERRYGKG